MYFSKTPILGKPTVSLSIFKMLVNLKIQLNGQAIQEWFYAETVSRNLYPKPSGCSIDLLT